MINFGNIRLSRFFVGSDSIQTILSGVTTLHGDYDDSNKSLTTITCSTPSGIIDTKTNLNASANTGVELIYSSDDTSIATVDASGTVSPLASGTTIITITASGTTIGNTTYRGAQKRLEVECNAPSFNPLTDSGYFVIQAIANNPTVTVNKNGSPTGSMSYRKNGEGEWASINSTTSISLQNDDYLEIKGNIKNSPTGNKSNCYFFSTNVASCIEIGGKLASLGNNTDINSSNNTIGDVAFGNIFRDCSGLVSAEHLIIPSNASNYCYFNTFRGCSNLTNAPIISASTLAYTQCCSDMFNSCNSLVSVEFFVTTLGGNCFRFMFSNCKGLQNIYYHVTDTTNVYQGWLTDVKSYGTLYCPSNATYSASGLGLPSTWTLSKTL